MAAGTIFITGVLLVVIAQLWLIRLHPTAARGETVATLAPYALLAVGFVLAYEAATRLYDWRLVAVGALILGVTALVLERVFGVEWLRLRSRGALVMMAVSLMVTSVVIDLLPV